jgi:hypothetical protein
LKRKTPSFSIQASDPNNNNVFVTNSQQQQQQQQSTLLGLQQTVTQPSTVQTNKTISTVLPSITPQQLNQFQVQHQQQQQIHIQPSNTVQPFNIPQMRVCTTNLIAHSLIYFFPLAFNDGPSTNKLHCNSPAATSTTTTATTTNKSYACSTTTTSNSTNI